MAAFLAAMAPRLSTWGATFGRPLVLLEGTDPYYHLRRIELALANNLLPPAIDTYNNHPFGATVDWPPGFDIFFALAWHLYSRLTADPVTPAAFGAVGVTVLGSLAAAAALGLAARWGLRAGIVAGLCVAWSPAAVAYSRVGRLDHHAIEPLSLVVLCGTYAWSRRGRAGARAAVLGLVLSLSTVFWVGAVFYAGALALAFGLEAWTRGEDVARQGAVVYLVATATSAAIALTSPWGRDLDVVYYALSWFQPLVFGSIALAFGTIVWLEGRGVARVRAWTIGGIGLILWSGLVLVAGDGSAERGLHFLLGADPMSATVLESRSLLDMGLSETFRWLTPVVLVLPLLWIAAGGLAVRRRLVDPVLPSVLALGIVAMPFALLQMRFGPHAALVSGLLAGWLLSRAAPPRVATAALVAVAASLAWSVRPGTLPDSVVHPYVLGGFDALVWLRRAPPATSHLRQPRRTPEYGVAAEWLWGHWITQIGQKPNIANPLGQTPRNLQGATEVARLFLEESEDSAIARAKRLGIRYLLLSSIPATVSELAVQAGRDPARYVVGDPEADGSFRRPFFDTFHSRLYLGRGAGEEGTGVVSGVRMVFESRVRIDFLGPRPAVRIFEIVPGATLTGRCPTGVVEIEAALEESGLVYRARSSPEPDGEFSVRTPYASEGTAASLPALVTARCGELLARVRVSERDVLEGREVAVVWGTRSAT